MMELHLHLGAHKTATTHFQNVLEENKSLYKKNACYVSMGEFRESVTRADRFIDPKCSSEVDSYLNKLLEIKSKSLIVSEENIVGHIIEMYRSNRLYNSMEKRLNRLNDFISNFSDVTVWFSIRSMDTYLPSMYCESLLLRRYGRFGKILSGQYAQSWVPVVSAIKETLACAKIKIIPYESYCSVLPMWLETMTGTKTGWDLLEGDRPRATFSNLAVKSMLFSSPFIPQSKVASYLEYVSRYSNKLGGKERFMPFGEDVRSSLKALYEKDLIVIEGLDDDISLFGG